MVNDLKELQALLKMCRKAGVDTIDVGTMHIKFGAAPSKHQQENDDDVTLSPDELTFEQLAFLSAPNVGA